MHPSQIPEKELFASVNTDNKILNKEPIFFFERSDGEILAVPEQQAWTLYSRRAQMLGKQPLTFKLVGTGDGTIFYTALREAQKETDINKAKELLKKGQQDEYEACKGKVIPPRNFDKFGDGAQFV